MRIKFALKKRNSNVWQGGVPSAWQSGQVLETVNEVKEIRIDELKLSFQQENGKR